MRFKKKKNSKKRGSKFCGYGRGAAHHKGAGNRGGRGRAGTGKRADTKKPSYWHLPVGRQGFSSKSRIKIKAINLEDINKNLVDWAEKGLATRGAKDAKDAEGFTLELGKLGYNKLLGNGKVNEKLVILTDFASKNAISKVREAGGEVQVLKSIAKKKKPESKKKAADGKSSSNPSKPEAGPDNKIDN
ncbi:uL15 family ribosomal protein [Candidatus Woesearchaeota archaeon]|nr:uL15 family ribosomal protein [Candidatus Woesearchaeota archaeon]